MHESLSLASLSQLPSYLRARANAAADGSSADLSFLLRLFPKATDPRLALLTPLLYIHLDPSRIPTPAALDSILCDPGRQPELCQIVGACVALRAVSQLMEVQRLPPLAYTDLWPRIYRWITFIHAYLEVIPTEYSLDTAAAYRASALVILTLDQYKDTKVTVNDAAGLRRILAEYWAKIVRKVITTDVDLSAIVIFIFDSDKIEEADTCTEILDGIGGSEEDLAYLLVQQINNTAASPMTDSTSMAMYAIIQVLGKRIRHETNTGSLCAGMLIHGGVKAVMDAIVFMEKARYGRTEILGEGVYLLVLFLVGNFESDAGAFWVSQALSAGLLSLIVSMGRARQTEKSELWITYSLLQRLLKKILPEHFGRYENMVQIKEDLPAALSITSTPPFARCLIYPFWTEFADLVRERLGALDLFVERRGTSLNACENLKCRKTGERRAFRTCAGCRLACYCSRECQTNDWVVAHRNACETLRSIGPATARDRGYIRANLQFNFESRAIRIKVLTQQARFMYSNPGMGFVTVFNFTRNASGTEWIDFPRGTSWSEVKPRYGYLSAVPERLAQLTRSDQEICVYLVVLSFNERMTDIERMFPMWSPPQLHNSLAGIVQELPRGLQPAALDAALVQPLKRLATSGADLMRQIYY
ncbi:hypothetical protein DFH06DRAFT_1473282 [Mycena polygramma]|nr:hypothetical protein DFH06DRAFT_1473282 [Mycena polygramma]